MRSYRRASVVAGMTATPREFMAEVDGLASVMNALDRDNFPTPPVLTSNKAKLGAWHRLKTEATASVQGTVHQEGQSRTDYPIPNSAGNAWVHERPTEDGYMECSLYATFSCYQPIWIGIRVDGLIVVRSPWFEDSGDRESALITVAIPVGVGTRRIEAIYGHDFETGAVTSWTTSFYDRRLSSLEMLR